MPRSPLNVFVAYHETDAELQKEVLVHLAAWKPQRTINIWSQNNIIAGENTNNQIAIHLERANLVLLLLSAKYMASDQYESVILRALELHQAGKTYVIPILLRPVDLADTPLASLKMLPSDKRAVINWPQKDNAFSDIRQGIQQVIAQMDQPPTGTGTSDPAKEARLKAIWTNDQYDFVQDRVDRFVGREIELATLQARIDGKLDLGGYVIITGIAGQGKSSIIAKLVQANGIETSAYHFIQYNSSDDYRISLLRKLMARLILKYDLPERYSERASYPVLRDYFFRVLEDISDLGKQEIIYLDGLDQLATHSSSKPDLSFLPGKLPHGIVMVIGTRHNDTVHEWKKITKTTSDDDLYELGHLSRKDFDLLLQHHHVNDLSEALGNRFYEAMQKNALYLDLTAQELGEQHDLQPEALITRIANNPDSIFTIAFSHMQQLRPEWDEVIRPILGILLVAREALTQQQIGHICSVESYRIKDGIMRLGGLLTRIGHQQYTLFHRKLYEYLKENPDHPDEDYQFDIEEEQSLHSKLADWCGQGTMATLWSEDSDLSPREDYREYARKHFVAHLYDAHAYERIFAVLDAGEYERGKLRADTSTRSTVLDLRLGSQAAARKVSPLKESQKLLTHLWRYTLLRSSLATQADTYPSEAFEALLELGREREALDLAELLTHYGPQLEALTLILQWLLQQPERQTEAIQLSNRAYEVALLIEDNGRQAKGLRTLATVLADAGQLVQAESIARTIHTSDERVRALSYLAMRLQLANEEEKARTFWQEASMSASAVTDNDERAEAFYNLAMVFMQAGEWEQAETTIRAISNKYEQIKAWSQLALFLTRAGLNAQAVIAWTELQTLVDKATKRSEHDRAQSILAVALAQDRRWDEAETIAKGISDSIERNIALAQIAAELIKGGLWERGSNIINTVIQKYAQMGVASLRLDTILICLSKDQAREEQYEQAQIIARNIPNKEAQCKALMNIVSELARNGYGTQAEAAWSEARALCTVQIDTVQAKVTGILVSILVEVGQHRQAKEIAESLPDKDTREYVMSEMAVALADAGQIEDAAVIANEIMNLQHKATVQKSVALALAKAGQTEQAKKTVLSIVDKRRQLDVLDQLVTIYCQRKQWNQAEATASFIFDDVLKNEALSHILSELVRDGQIGSARAIIRSMQQQEYFKANAICALVTALAQMGAIQNAQKFVHDIKKNPLIRQKAECNLLIGAHWLTQAESTAKGIDEGDERDEALRNLAIAYAQAQSWEQAKKIADMINNRNNREEALSALAIELAKAGRWEQASTMLNAIQKSGQRVATIQVWGILLARPESYEKRENILQHLSEHKEKASLLVSIADELVKRSQYLELVSIIQQAWLEASTKDDCLHLFAMIRGLLRQAPELCTDFYASFAWLDTFLK